MAIKTFTYQEEKDGAVIDCIEKNPVYYRRNYPEYVEILTGADIPQEQPAQAE